MSVFFSLIVINVTRDMCRLTTFNPPTHLHTAADSCTQLVTEVISVMMGTGKMVIKGIESTVR